MNNFTMNTYEMKREIINFSKKICNNSDKPTEKFVVDMVYGILKSKDILLSNIAEALQEETKKANTIDRLSDNLALDLPENFDNNYRNLAMDTLGNNPVFLIDDSDVIKPLGKKFEDLGIVRDGSSLNKSYEKGYHVTEIVGLTQNKRQPISMFSKIHSSTSKDYVSANRITFEAIDSVCDLLEQRGIKGTFVNDRGYDSNEMFNYYFKKEQNFIIRLKENRKIYFKHKWYPITTIRDSRKGKVKIKLMFQGEEKECLISVLRVQITAKKKWINLVLVYGLGETPMILATNLDIKSKEDLIKVSRCYIDRWRIEEYFKFKKQEYNFENFRVRSLKSINNLNRLLTYAIGMIGILSDKIGKRKFVQVIINEANQLKDTVYLWFYRFSRGIFNILKKARTGIKEWQNIRKAKIFDGQLSLL